LFLERISDKNNAFTVSDQDRTKHNPLITQIA